VPAVSFTVDPSAYDRYMGRYSLLLAPQLADLAGASAGQRMLDVGCGPGALTGELVKRLGAAAVTAVDPSEPFVAAVEERHPGVDVRRAVAEQLPFQDAEFDATLAQLVVLLMEDPAAGVAEMVRVIVEAVKPLGLEVVRRIGRPFQPGLTADTYTHVLMDYREIDRSKLLERARTPHTLVHTQEDETATFAATF
jgi:ubiquinone/menaquinone biosynthesis C-methylase UbiE